MPGACQRPTALAHTCLAGESVRANPARPGWAPGLGIQLPREEMEAGESEDAQHQQHQHCPQQEQW